MHEPRKSSDKFHGDVGSFITAADAKSRTRQHRAFEEGKLGLKPDEVTKAEFFGINRISKLMGRKDCVGIRIYYGKRYEDADGDPTTQDKGELKPRLVLVGVRADGSDIFEDKEGLKDMIGDGDALADGAPCPQFC
ncbi:hypothetical protein [Larkinella terrae]|uniref:Uncharacterized protein n=1 Tax=Larkinella terrae TaxID=2025311 RepID=A0A7K0ESC2_9BACT|nr:hypothetical protein [Larkinella terrae]MRS64436.1 hypothetical protein [Larkinella terrae]